MPRTRTSPLSLHDALPISLPRGVLGQGDRPMADVAVRLDLVRRLAIDGPCAIHGQACSRALAHFALLGALDGGDSTRIPRPTVPTRGGSGRPPLSDDHEVGVLPIDFELQLLVVPIVDLAGVAQAQQRRGLRMPDRPPDLARHLQPPPGVLALAVLD